MNIFQSGSAQFRRGSIFDETTDNTSTRAAGTALLGDADPVAQRSSVRDLSALLASAQPRHHQLSPPPPPPISAAEPASTQRSVFPSTPYYGLLSHCEVHIDVAVAENADEEGGKAVGVVYNPPSTVHHLGQLQRLLNTCAETHGAVYHLGTASSPYAAPPTTSLSSSSSPPSTAASAGTALTHTTYVEAMQDGFRQMLQLRASMRSPSCLTQHCFYMRLLGHPVWKDLGLLLCVEGSRLLLCLLSSSRVTQQRLTVLCAEVEVELAWVSGAALVVEPASLPRGTVNSVWAVWEAVLHLPLHTTASSQAVADALSSAEKAGDAGAGASSSSAVPDGAFSGGVRAALEGLRRAAHDIRGCQLSLVSSLPFRHARRCPAVGRFTEEALLYTPDTAARTPAPRAAASANNTTSISTITESSAAAPRNAHTVTDVRRPVARRYVWRLLPLHAWVTPHYFTELVRCLVETCALRTFTLRCRGPSADPAAAVGSGGSGAVSADATGGPARRWGEDAGSGVAGVRLVRGTAPSFLQLRRGPSSVSWTAFSRLSSGAAWVDAETREGLAVDGVLHSGGGGFGEEAAAEAEEEMELEFELTTVQYVRCTPPVSPVPSFAVQAAACAKRPREEAGEAPPVDGAACGVRPEMWGPSFSFGVSVKRLIVVDDGEP